MFNYSLLTYVVSYLLTMMSTKWMCYELRMLQYNLIPKAEMSLKVLAELPIIVVLMYQLYKQHVHNDVAEFIPLIMNTIVLQPTPQQRFGSVQLNTRFSDVEGRGWFLGHAKTVLSRWRRSVDDSEECFR